MKFHLVSFDFSFGIIWFHFNQINFTWLALLLIQRGRNDFFIFFIIQRQFIIRILSASDTLSCFRLINDSLLLVYFPDIFGIWSCTCMFIFLFLSKGEGYLKFHLVTFDFSFGIIWFQFNQVNLTWFLACYFFKMLYCITKGEK